MLQRAPINVWWLVVSVILDKILRNASRVVWMNEENPWRQGNGFYVFECMEYFCVFLEWSEVII